MTAATRFRLDNNGSQRLRMEPGEGRRYLFSGSAALCDPGGGLKRNVFFGTVQL